MKDLTDFLDKYNVSYTIEGDRVVCENVDLSNKQLTSLPESFGNLKCNVLDLSDNNIKSLPESIGNIKVNELYLHYNNLTSLPESIGNLKAERLYLYNNKLTSLPESIGNLKCNELYLYNNNLTSLPESIRNIKVERLDLSYNNLTSLPESIGNLKVERLDLYNNNLISLPESFGNIKINELYLYNNKLTSLPESFGNIKVKRLDLSNNNLISLPKHKKFKPLEITDDYIFCDGILTWYEKKKQHKEYTLFIGYHGQVVAKKGEFTAHAKTVKKAIKDLEFKIISSKLKKEPINKDTEFSVQYYRAITGACDLGVRGFMETNNIPFKILNEGTDDEETVELNKIKAIDLLPLLEKSNAYGIEQFKELLTF